MGNVATGIDLGSHAIKFVQLRPGPNGTCKMVNAGSKPVGEQGNEDSKLRAGNISVLLRNLLSNRGARASKAAVSVTGRKVIVRYAHVPPVPKWRLNQLMEYEIEEEAGGDGNEDIASDFHLLDLPNKATEFTVMVGLAKQEPVQFQMDVLDGAGVDIDNISLTSLAVFNSFRKAMKGREEDKHETCAVVNIGSQYMDMAIERDDRLYFARNLTPGGRSFTEALQQELRIPFANAERLKVQRGRIKTAGQDPTGDEDQPSSEASDDKDAAIDLKLDDDIPTLVLEGNPDDEDTALGFDDDAEKIAKPDQPDEQPQDPVSLALESAAHSILVALQSSLMYCKAQTRIADLKVDRLYLTGGAAVLPGLAEYLSSRLQIPIEILDPLKGIDLSGLDEQTRSEVERDRGSYSVALGLAMEQLDEECVSMTLLPAAVKSKRHFMQHGFYGYAAAISFVLSVGLIAGSSFLFTGKFTSWASELKAKERKAKTLVNTREQLEYENERIAAEVALAKRKLQQGRQYLTLLATIRGSIPDGIRITSMKTYDGSSPFYKTISRKADRFGARNKGKEPPPEPVIFLSGTVSDELPPKQKRTLVIEWADAFAKLKGLRGEPVFGEAEIVRHVAEGGKPGFDLRIPLIRHKQGKAGAVR